MNKKIIIGGLVAASVLGLTGCYKESSPTFMPEESKRSSEYTEKKLYIDKYDLKLTLDDDTNSLTTSVTADLYNNTDDSLEEIQFSLPADSILKSSGLSWEVTDVFADNDSASLDYTIDPQDSSIIKVALSEKLEPAGDMLLTLEVKENIPEENARFGHFEAGKYDQYVLSDCFPVVAEYRDGSFSTNIAQASDWHAEINAPNRFRAVSTGVENNDEDTIKIDAVDSRDFALVLSNGFRSYYWANDEFAVNYYYTEGSKDHAIVQEGVEKRVPPAMDWLEDFVDKYAWNEYDVVVVNGDFDYDTYTGLMTVGAKDVLIGIGADELDERQRQLRDFFTEGLLDQWFSKMTATDKKTDGWVAKGLDTWLGDLLKVYLYGDLKERSIAETIENVRSEHPTEMAMKLSDSFTDDETADIVNRYRGAELIEEIFNELGDDEFLSALSEYVTTFKYKEASGQDLINCFNNHHKRKLDKITEKYF